MAEISPDIIKKKRENKPIKSREIVERNFAVARVRRCVAAFMAAPTAIPARAHNNGGIIQYAKAKPNLTTDACFDFIPSCANTDGRHELNMHRLLAPPILESEDRP